MRKYIIAISALCVLASCESRKDVYELNNKEPQVSLSLKADFIDCADTVNVSLRHGKSSYVFYRMTDDRPDFLGPLQITNICPQYEGSLFLTALKANDGITIQVADTSDRICRDIQHHTVFECSVQDYYGKEGKAYINVTSVRNNTPVVSFTIEKISGMEYEVKTGCTDPDGDGIVLYEYLFDGEVIFNEDAFEIDNPAPGQPCANPGRAAIGGTYIVGTTLTHVKHSFQYGGVHTVYVRCKDSDGLWCKWESKDIDTNQ